MSEPIPAEIRERMRALGRASWQARLSKALKERQQVSKTKTAKKEKR